VVILWLGVFDVSKITMIVFDAIFPVVAATVIAIQGVDRELIWSARNMGASPIQILGKVVLPAAAPAVFAGFRVALPVALIVVIITEMIGSADGLGYFVMGALADLRTDRLLAAVVVTAALGWALDGLVVASRTRLIFWERHETYFN